MKKKWLYVWTFALLPLLLLQLETEAHSLFSIPVDKDAWVSESSPGTNYGLNSYLTVKDTSKRAEGFLLLSSSALSEFSGTRIVSASLYAYQYQGTYTPGDQILLHAVASDWQEPSITWDTKPAYLKESLGSLALTSGNNTWRRWDGLEGTVSSWVYGPNYGLALENYQDGELGELYSRFYSSEYSGLDKRPYFEVVTEPLALEPVTSTVPEPFTSSLLLIGIGARGVGRFKKNNR